MDKQPPRRVLAYLRETPWAILPSALDTMLEVVEARVSGEVVTVEERQSRIEAARRSPAPTGSSGSIAVLPLHGILSQRMDMFTEMSGGTSTERFGAAFQQAVADPNIAGIVIDVDSPGGSVYGVAELASQIAAARGSKPITTVANSLAASAAYWIGTQTDELVITPGGEVGSIGVIAAHDDLSKRAEMVGQKRTYIHAGKYKAEGNPFAPLGEEARAHIQEQVDDYYDQFVRAVASGRGVSLTKVREEFGQGRVFTARKAVGLGMADRIATLQEVIQGMASRVAKSSGTRADHGFESLGEFARAAMAAGKGGDVDPRLEEEELPIGAERNAAEQEVLEQAAEKPSNEALQRALALSKLQLAAAGRRA